MTRQVVSLVKSKTAWWKAYLEASDDVIEALTNLGVGESPNSNVLSGCEKLICQLFRTKACSHTQASELRWQQFKAMKGDQVIEKLSPTQGAMHEHIRRAHLQCNVWQQVLVACQSILDPNTLGWNREPNGELKPVLSMLPPAPESAVQVVKCNCEKSKFCSSNRCSSKIIKLCRVQTVQGVKLIQINVTTKWKFVLIQSVTQKGDEDKAFHVE